MQQIRKHLFPKRFCFSEKLCYKQLQELKKTCCLPLELLSGLYGVFAYSPLFEFLLVTCFSSELWQAFLVPFLTSFPILPVKYYMVPLCLSTLFLIISSIFTWSCLFQCCCESICSFSSVQSSCSSCHCWLALSHPWVLPCFDLSCLYQDLCLHLLMVDTGFMLLLEYCYQLQLVVWNLASPNAPPTANLVICKFYN